MKITPSVDVYKIEVEVLSPTCTGGVDNLSGGDDMKYKSYEYFIQDDRIYFVGENDIMNLLNLGILRLEDLEDEYEVLINKIIEKEDAKRYLKWAKLSKRLENKIDLFRFSKSTIIEEKGIREIPTIFGSTIKGILRTGFITFRDADVRYTFERNKKKKLILKNLTINNTEYTSKSVLAATFKKHEYTINIDNFKDDVIVNLIFKNIVCSDLKLYEGDMIIEKISRVNRKSKSSKKEKNSGIPQYFETPQIGAKFRGEIRYKYNDNKNTLLSAFSCLSKAKEAINPVEECFIGLKKLSDGIIEAEKRIMRQIAEDKLDNFYETLRQENKKENQFVFKLGYAGILSKTLMALDKVNLNNDEFLPYTINVVEDTKVPTGWVKIRWELE
ncbi:MAG: hypothetical protein N2486_05230 [Caloramator sp.]|nr:hypothetical protein [Caloramator sp.]